ncbi:MAG: hypothetical protein ACLQNE_32580 [Thermoguttaceae bacterium]
MNITSENVTGFIVGIGVAAFGFYWYKKNEAQVDEWLRRQSITLPGSSAKDQSGMSLEELLREKERLEDLVAEREMAEKSKSQAAPARK